MNRRVIIVVSGVALLAGVGFILIRPATQPAKPAGAVVKPAPPRATRLPGSPGPSSAAEPAPTPEPTAARRRPAARPESEPPPSSPAPAPVEAAPEAGTLRIDSDVPGAQVFIDREYIGATPVTAPNVRPGTHRLNVSVQGYDGVAETIEVTPGPRDIMVKLKEVRLDLKMDVVHKHRMGSCQGRLIATPQGLRYETANKNDAFSSPLLDLQTFEVDYLEKNLKVASRNGKRYDFTDPAADADRLFVFHRDVEKARDRLKKGDRPANE